MVSRVKTFLALLGLLAVPVTYGLVTGWNPLPGWWTKLSAVHTFSRPATTWKVRAADEPTSALATSDVVVVFEPNGVEAHGAVTGNPLWKADADWAVAAGSNRTGGAVVLLGTRGSGYRAADAFYGRTRWSDPKALGVWPYSDLVVDVVCSDPLSCVLRGRNPGTGAIKWQAPFDGNGRALIGVDRAVSAPRALSGGYAASLANLPVPAPPLLGLRLDGRVQVYATATGRRLGTYTADPTRWATVVGDRVLVITAAFRGGTCRYGISGVDPASGREVWQKSGWDVHTSSGLGCDQRRDPLGGAGLITAAAPDGQDAVLDARTGAQVYQPRAGETVLATDGDVIAVRTAGHDSVKAVRRSGGVLWTRPANRHALVGMADGNVVITDADSGRVAAVSAVSGRVLVDARTGATVLGYADTALVLNLGRTVGLLPYGSVAP